MNRPVIDLAQSRCFLFAVGLIVRSAQEIKKAVRLSLRWFCKHAAAIMAVALMISSAVIAELSCNGIIPNCIGLVLIAISGSAAIYIVYNIAKRGDTDE